MNEKTYMNCLIKRIAILVFIFLFNGISLLAQEDLQVEGTVLDSESKVPISGVTVRLSNSTEVTSTNSKGQYVIKARRNGNLTFDFIGYKRQEVKVDGARTININLISENRAIDEVVVVAYGEQKKISVTGAISSVSGEELRKSSSANFTATLAGRISGLTAIQSGGGQPGVDNATLYLRGAATTNGKSPLILIDGVPRDNLQALDASEVESVTTLKDASATAVFGVRGANGVLLITTRRGVAGKTEFSASLDQSYSAFTREPERLHSWEYIDLRNEASLNDQMPLRFSSQTREKFVNPLLGLDPNDPDYESKVKVLQYIYPDHDYYRMFIRRYTPQSRVNVTASGGTEKVKFFVNTAYLHQGGNLNVEPESKLGYNSASKLDRYNFRANLDYDISSSFKTYLNLGSYIEQVNMPSASAYPSSSPSWMMRDIFFQAQSILPITPGPLTIDGFGVEPGQIVDPGYLDRSAFEVMNRMGYRNTMRSNLNGTFGADWNLATLITKGLSLKGMISYDSYASTTVQGAKLEPLYRATVNYDTDELSYTVFRPDENRLSVGRSVSSRYNINVQGSLHYKRNFGKHDVTGLILGQRDFWETNGGEIPYNVIGLVGRTTYGYDNRYLAEINMGYNGSEQFSPTKRFGFFPAFSLGWVLSNERFLKEHPVLTNLKLRGSHGKVGNDQMDGKRFLYQSDITMGGGPLGSLSQGRGVNQGLLGNPNITWETAKKTNVGLDVQLFKDLDLAFDVYQERRSDILLTRGTVPSLQGVPLGNIPKVNMGIVNNKGFEIEYHYRKIFSDKLTLRSNGNLGFNKNKVVFLDEARRGESYSYRYTTTGFPLHQAWGHRIDYSNGNGYFNSKEELDEYLSRITYSFGVPRVGDFKYIDLNQDEVIDDKDVAPIKNSAIPGIIYGFDVGGTYKNWDFTVFFQGVGRYSTNFAEQGVWETTKEGNYFGYHRTAWTEERYKNGENITYPALSTQLNTNHRANDFFIMDRSFIRLKNVELAYTFNQKFLSHLGIKHLRAYISGQNLVTWDKLKMTHHDPEYNDAIGYPITKMYSFGCNIRF